MIPAMLKFLTSLSFLYIFTIGLLLLYGFTYYRNFVKSGYQRKRFPLVFILITAACFSFLYFNIHAPLKLKTFNNLDHHFIRHEGFEVSRSILLGRSDTVNNPDNSFNRFAVNKENNQLTVSSVYSEEPFYAASTGSYKMLSVTYPATGHSILFRCDSVSATVRTRADSSFELTINNQPVFKTGKIIRKGSSAWHIFKDDESFINSSYYTNEKLINGLKDILLLRDNVSKKEGGELKYFLSGRIFRLISALQYDEEKIKLNDLAFKNVVDDKTTIAWGIGFLDNNRNQFRINSMGNDSFALINRYPVSYPLTEENRNDWNPHGVNKFLASDSKDMLNMPAIFREGFLFPAFNDDNTINFSPVLLGYQKSDGNEPVKLKARYMNHWKTEIPLQDNKLILPAKSADFSWIFSVQNTFDWNFGNKILSMQSWQLLLFGSLLFFFLMVFFTSLLKPADKLSWVWQLLSCISLVLLTTRFFLYWRYKSFPPYEGMDFPSQQQLQSFWNFGIIILAAILLGAIFGFSLLQYIYIFIRKRTADLLNKPYSYYKEKNNFLNHETIGNSAAKIPLVKRFGAETFYFTTWLLLLVAGAGFAKLNNFDPGICRHLAIALMLLYFIYVFISYKHSPLVASAEKSWWSIGTQKGLDILINNPVKVLLSISLLAIFIFIDIGFAIVFLNFLLFNEAFLCINYAIAGLSAGSQKNAKLFGVFGSGYLLAFILNLLYAPYIFKFLLDLPQAIYLAGYFLFAVVISLNLVRLLVKLSERKKILTGSAAAGLLFVIAFFFFPKEKILQKAEITKYRIDVMTKPVAKVIESAYEEGKTYEPVIRAAQNQWFINTFIYEKNNPGVNSTGFHLLPHAPQNKGAKYNAQATDLVASRFFIAEHGKWSVLLYVLLLLLPATLLASFYKLYPDFTNRVNINYPTITSGFSVLNFLAITALLVILAATGRYIFFGQDLPFGSILSKQSVLFPSILIIVTVLLFKNIPLERYPNQKKFIPGAIVFAGLAMLLFLVKPGFNRNKEFAVTDLAKDMDSYIQLRLQPLLDYFDSSKGTRKFSMTRKDQLFTDSVRKLFAAGFINDGGSFIVKQIEGYSRSGFSDHLNQGKILYIELYSGHPRLAVNDNYFRVEPPPHLQQSWAGSVYGDTTVYNVALWNQQDGSMIRKRRTNFTNEPYIDLNKDWELSFRSSAGENIFENLYLVNRSVSSMLLQYECESRTLKPGDSIKLLNPYCIIITDSASRQEKILTIEPDAFMKNFYVNGSRFYVYPMGNHFTWARNFAETVSTEYSSAGQMAKNAFVSFDFEMMDSLSAKMQGTLGKDTAYKKGTEYAICIADGNGRLIAMNDFIKEINRPDPNDKAGFIKATRGENGFVSQSLLRKQIGNINLLRLNPGPGSTLKPIVFSAIASQLNLDWDLFASEGFTEPQHFFGGEKVAEYDFEKNNGRIGKLADYLKYSDNYYHSNVLLLGSYPKQSLQHILASYFADNNPESKFHWPYFSYNGKQYWLNGFENWPGYINGKANFGLDSSFVSIGLFNNYGIYTGSADKSFDKFSSNYDSLLFLNAADKSGFLLPEYALFDQQGNGINHYRPDEVFMACFRGHVKGSSQVMIPPIKMLDVYGKLISQNRNYSLTLNPYATAASSFSPFDVDNSIPYNNYLSIIRENVFEGMRQALFNGTAARLGTFLKDGAPYYYYAKTGTTGDNEAKTKSKLFTIIISSKDITNPDFNFRNNKFYIIYFTSQNGPAKQNEEFQAEVIKYIQQTPAFNKYMKSG